MSNLSLSRVSELMSPLERVKMIISLELKGMDEMDITKDEDFPTEGEIGQIVAACPSSQGRQYNFLIRMKDTVWRRLWMLIEMDQQYLEILDGRMSLVRHLLNIAPLLSNGLQLIKKQFDASKSGEEDFQADKEREVVLKYLDSLLVVKVEEPETGRMVVRLVNPLLEKGLEDFQNKFIQTVGEIHRYIALIKKIEQKHFEGMEIISRDPTSPTGIIGRAEAAIVQMIERHNRDLKRVEEDFNLLGMDQVEYKFEKLEKYFLEDSQIVDDVWLEKKLDSFEEEARG